MLLKHLWKLFSLYKFISEKFRGLLKKVLNNLSLFFKKTIKREMRKSLDGAERRVPAVRWKGARALWHTRAIKGNVKVQLEWKSLIAPAERWTSPLLDAAETSQNLASKTVNLASLKAGEEWT